jgi:hypothetical protein
MIALNDPEKKLTYYGFRLLAVVIPALITSYFSYRSAKVEAEGNSTVKTAAGYKATYTVIQDMQDQLKQQSLAIATLSGEVQALRDMMSLGPQSDVAPVRHKATHGLVTLSSISLGTGGGTGVSPSPSPAPAPPAPPPPSYSSTVSAGASSGSSSGMVGVSTSGVTAAFAIQTDKLDAGIDLTKQVAKVYQPLVMPKNLDAVLKQQKIE